MRHIPRPAPSKPRREVFTTKISPKTRERLNEIIERALKERRVVYIADVVELGVAVVHVALRSKRLRKVIKEVLKDEDIRSVIVKVFGDGDDA